MILDLTLKLRLRLTAPSDDETPSIDDVLDSLSMTLGDVTYPSIFEPLLTSDEKFQIDLISSDITSSAEIKE